MVAMDSPSNQYLETSGKVKRSEQEGEFEGTEVEAKTTQDVVPELKEDSDDETKANTSESVQSTDDGDRLDALFTTKIRLAGDEVSSTDKVKKGEAERDPHQIKSSVDAQCVQQHNHATGNMLVRTGVEAEFKEENHDQAAVYNQDDAASIRSESDQSVDTELNEFALFWLYGSEDKEGDPQIKEIMVILQVEHQKNLDASIQEGGTTANTEQDARKRMAEDKEGGEDLPGNADVNERLKSRPVDGNTLEVKPYDITIYSGKPTPGLLVLRALRELVGRHKLQNEAELTFIKGMLFEVLSPLGCDRLSSGPALLKPLKEPNNTESATFISYCESSKKTRYWVEAPFEHVSNYIADKKGDGTTFEKAWEEFVKACKDIAVPVTFMRTMADIKQSKTINELLEIFQSEYFQSRLGLLETVQMTSGLNIEEWSKRWAKLLARNDARDIKSLEAYNLNMVRKMCLQLLYSLHDLVARGEFSIDDIVNQFGIEKIHRILRICLPMDRQNALRNMVDRRSARKIGTTKVPIRGMIWFAEERDRDIVQKWRKEGDPRMNRATINKRLVWYFSVPEFGLSQDLELVEVMKPCRTPVDEIKDVYDISDD